MILFHFLKFNIIKYFTKPFAVINVAILEGGGRFIYSNDPKIQESKFYGEETTVFYNQGDKGTYVRQQTFLAIIDVGDRDFSLRYVVIVVYVVGQETYVCEAFRRTKLQFQKSFLISTLSTFSFPRIRLSIRPISGHRFAIEPSSINIMLSTFETQSFFL